MPKLTMPNKSLSAVTIVISHTYFKFVLKIFIVGFKANEIGKEMDLGRCSEVLQDASRSPDAPTAALLNNRLRGNDNSREIAISNYLINYLHLETLLDSDAHLLCSLFHHTPKIFLALLSQPAITCSKLTIETLKQGVKYVQS